MTPSKPQLAQLDSIKTAMTAIIKGKPVPRHIRRQALSLLNDGLPSTMIADKTGLNRWTIERWRREERKVTPSAPAEHVRPLVYQVDPQPIMPSAGGLSLSFALGEFVITIAPRMAS